jgi:DNA polymerase-1
MFGRVRQFDEIYSEDDEARSKALRAGCNHLIQSTASDMMLICLCTIEKLMRDAQLNSMLVSTVHDSLVIDAVRSELNEVHQIVNWVMNNIPSVVETAMPDYDTSWMYQVPFAGDSEVGLNYLDTNKVSGEHPDWEELLKPAGGHGS